MANEFYISTANPIRFYPEEENYNPGVYYIRQMEDAPYFKQIRDYQSKIVYNQKYTLQDSPMVQIMSTYDDIICELVNCETKIVSDTFAVNMIATDLVGQDFDVYQFSCDFTEEGLFFLRLKYKNSIDPDYIVMISEPLEIKQVHPNTLRFEYTNSKNDFSIIFNSDFIGLVRCEGDILEYQPASDNTIYTDQVRNTTLTRSVPYSKYSLVIGGNVNKTYGGIPDYMVDIVNHVMSCDQVKIDGKYFTKSEGSDWEELRFQNYPLSAQRISVNRGENKFQLEFENTLPIEDMAFVYRKLSFIGNNADITITNILKQYTGLVKICFRNVGTPVTMRIYTTTTGNIDDIDQTVTISDASTTLDIDQFFSSDKVLKIESEDWSTIDIFVVYEKLDASNTSGSGSGGGIQIGMVVIYEEVNDGDFELDFDTSTGLGRPDRAYYGYALCNGDHSTRDRRGKLSRAVDGITESAGIEIGSNSIIIDSNQLPEHNHLMFGNSKNSSTGSNPGNNDNLEPYTRLSQPDESVASMGGQSGFGQYRMGKSSEEPSIGRTSAVGANEPIDITNECITDIYIKRIF